MVEIKDTIYCHVHGCVHERTNDPYDYGCEEARKQNGGEYPEGDEPECGPENWSKLWIGGDDDRPYPFPNEEK